MYTALHVHVLVYINANRQRERFMTEKPIGSKIILIVDKKVI